MRVVVNQLSALGMKTGIGHYAVELLRALRAQAGADLIEGYPQGWVRKVRRAAASARPLLEGKGAQAANTAQAAPPRRSLRGAAVGQLRHMGRSLMAEHFRWTARHKRYDVYHEPNFIPLPCECPTIATLHDLSVLLHPEWHPADRVAHFERHFHKEIRRCAHFITVSEFCRQEVIETLGIAPERVTKVYPGIRPGLGAMASDRVQTILRHLDLPSRYLLYLGTVEPRKNLVTLLRAYDALPDAFRATWPLVLVGGWGWNSSDVAELLNHARHRGVVHVGYVKEKHLPAIYCGARALVYPSLYEGFGLPPLEMMACGGAVLASTAGPLRETIAGHAHLIDPLDQEGWSQAMTRVATDDDWWRQLREEARAVALPFTWERCAAETLQIYRQVAGEPAMEALPLRMAG
jgi:alpha-1,3-rhamnosyl/mannosyltransferase